MYVWIRNNKENSRESFMTNKKETSEEEFVFEFYDEDYAKSLEEVEKPVVTEEYNDIDFEADLNEEQLEIVNNVQGPMLVIAGAGSGKTRTIVYSVAKLLVSGVKPSQIMLVTFTNKAAHEMVKRVEILLGKKPKGIWGGTFHSIANRFLRMYAKTLGLKPNFTIMDETDAKGLMKLSIDKVGVKDLEERFPTSAMVKSILSFSINCNKSIKEVIQWKYGQFDSDPVHAKLNEVIKVYNAKKADDGLLDFDDLLVFWSRLLDERNIAKLIASRIKYVLVDEYQDTNYIQDEIIHKIVLQNPERNIMAVGDDAQSIYAFRGANFQNILNFENNYKKCKRYTITYNYRSVPQILELANDCIDHNENQFKKSMKATRPSGVKPFQVNVGDDKDQARFIANQILQLRQDGYKLNEMAILVRAGFHTIRIELELKAKNIPYEVRAGVAFFEKAHIKDMIAHLRVIENPYDEISWSRIFGIVSGIGNVSGSKIFEAISKTDDPIVNASSASFIAKQLKGARISKEGVKNLLSHAKNLIGFTIDDAPTEVIKKLIGALEDYVKAKYENWQDRIEDLRQMAVYAQNYPSTQKFLENLSLNASALESRTSTMGSPNEEEKPVVLSTIHRAKGLEWRVVFIPMLCEDFFPSSRVVGDSDAYEEERRVFYVATTRTKDELYLVSPAVIESYRGLQTVRVSQFVEELKPKVYKRSTVRYKSPPNSKKNSKKSNRSLFTTADKLGKK